MRSTAATLAIVFALSTSLNAQDGVGIGVFNIAPSPGSTVPAPSYQYEIMDGLVTAFIQQQWGQAHGTTYSFDVYGDSDAGFIIYAGHQMQNNTPRTWVGFQFDITGDYQPFVEFGSAPGSNVMTLVSSTDTSLNFGLPSPVHPGESVSFYYAIDAGGEYLFTLTQTPMTIPEPPGCILLPISFLISMLAGPRLRCSWRFLG
jgi:hypothetical protein